MTSPRRFRLRAVAPLEKDEQAALFAWRTVAQKQIPELRWLFAVPNGVWLPDTYARSALKQGLTAGVCDVMLLVPRGNEHGLLLELKRQDASFSHLSSAQKEFLHHHRELGYRAEWCRGWEQAKNVILEYLAITDDEPSNRPT